MIPSFDKDEFIRLYKHYKSQHLLEIEIARKLQIHSNTLYQLKKKYGLPLITGKTRELTNKNGLNRDQLNFAKENGLDSSAVNMRMREYGWTIEDATTVKPLRKGQKFKGKRVFDDGIK